MSAASRGGGYRLLRTALIGCLASVVGAVALVVGMRVPSSLIQPGTESFTGEGRKIAGAFYSYEMWRKFGEGPEAYAVTGARVTEVHRCPGAPPYDSRSTLTYGTEISGTIRVHTVFGIPYRKIEAKCSATG
jgi:hypothetical protein